VFLFGPQGCGKTYLAARVAEISRPSCYIFWYSCRRFDAVENLIEQLDVFLGTLGLHDKFSAQLYKLGAASVAEQIIRFLRKLDQPTLLVLDNFENVTEREVQDDKLSLSST